MNDIGSWLRAHDPLRDEATWSAAEAERVRRAIEKAGASPAPGAWRPGFVAIAAMLALTLAASMVAGRYLPKAVNESSTGRVDVVRDPDARLRQLQFSTRGGTRVIWVFKPDFTL